jgi:hypothetical protein
MKSFLTTILLACFLFCFTKNIHAQDFSKTDKMKRNCIKIGTSFTLTKIFFSYEHAITKKISTGGIASASGGNFYGYSGMVFSRFYFNRFNKSGWFMEARGSYSHFNSIVYSDYYTKPYEESHLTFYTGRHIATIPYVSAGLSAGYKVFCSKHVFFEFMGGVHYGKATFGKDDLYISRSSLALLFGGNDVVKSVFKNSGPAFPLHFMINFGFAF